MNVDYSGLGLVGGARSTEQHDRATRCQGNLGPDRGQWVLRAGSWRAHRLRSSGPWL